MSLPTPKQTLILLLGLYINAGYILGAFPFRCSRRDLKVVIATGKHDMRRTGSRLSTIVSVWLFYFALAYKEIADPGVSKFGSMFKFLIASNAWLTYLMQQNFVHRNEEVVAAINQSIKLFSNAPGGGGKQVLFFNWYLLSTPGAVIVIGFFTVLRCKELLAQSWHGACLSSDSDLALNGLRLFILIAYPGAIVTILIVNQVLFITIMGLCIITIRLYMIDLSDKMDVYHFSWSKFYWTHRAMTRYIRKVNLCLGAFLFPAFMLHVMTCMVLCSNALFSPDVDAQEKLTHGSLFSFYCVGLAYALKKICWNSNLATDLLWKQKRLLARNPVKKRQLRSLSGLWFWFGCFGAANEGTHHLIINHIVDTIVTMLLM